MRVNNCNSACESKNNHGHYYILSFSSSSTFENVHFSIKNTILIKVIAHTGGTTTTET